MEKSPVQSDAHFPEWKPVFKYSLVVANSDYCMMALDKIFTFQPTMGILISDLQDYSDTLNNSKKRNIMNTMCCMVCA